MRHRVIITLAILVLLPAAASAGPFNYYGPHIGFGQGPDQTVIGGQLQWNGIAPRMAFVPGVDYGFNDVSSVLTLNGDFHYNLSYETTWQPYVGLGAEVNNWRETVGRNRDRTETSTTTGGHVVVGAAIRNRTGGRFFTELKLGLGDSPDMKMLLGWNMRSR
jgi:hypothetical protein